jgi:uncharacterized protein (TIGR03067 family)
MLCIFLVAPASRVQSFLMNTRLAAITIAALSALAALAAEPTQDRKALQGTWTIVKAELGGQPMDAAVANSISLKIREGKYEVSVGGALDKGTYTLDSKSRPKGMTVTGTDGPNQGKTLPAIYEVHGDTLRICYDLSGGKRPAEFKTSAGTQLFLVTYSRKKE